MIGSWILVDSRCYNSVLSQVPSGHLWRACAPTLLSQVLLPIADVPMLVEDYFLPSCQSFWNYFLDTLNFCIYPKYSKLLIV